jgi:hypothetical protein
MEFLYIYIYNYWEITIKVSNTSRILEAMIFQGEDQGDPENEVLYVAQKMRYTRYVLPPLLCGVKRPQHSTIHFR